MVCRIDVRVSAVTAELPFFRQLKFHYLVAYLKTALLLAEFILIYGHSASQLLPSLLR